MKKAKLFAIVLIVFMVILAVSCKNEASEPAVDDNIYVAPEGYLGAWVFDSDSGCRYQIVLNDDCTCTYMLADVKGESLRDVHVVTTRARNYKVYEDVKGLEDFSIICTNISTWKITHVGGETDSSGYSRSWSREEKTGFINLFYDEVNGYMYYYLSESEIDPDIDDIDAAFKDIKNMPKFSDEAYRPKYLIELADDQANIEGVWMTSDGKTYKEYIFKDGKISRVEMTLQSVSEVEDGDYVSYSGSYGSFIFKGETSSSEYHYSIFEYGNETYLEFEEKYEYNNEKGLLKKIDKSNYNSSVKTSISGVYTYQHSESTTTVGTLSLGIYGEYAQDKKDSETNVAYDGRSILVASEDGGYALADERDLTVYQVREIVKNDKAELSTYVTYKIGTITFTPDKGFARTWTYYLLVEKTPDGDGNYKKTLVLRDEGTGTELNFKNYTTTTK